MGTVTKVLMISLLMVAGRVIAQPTTNVLDAATRKEAEATLARGMAWLQTQQTADGRIGTNEHAAVTAMAIAAIKAAGVRLQTSRNSEQTTGETLTNADGFIHAFIIANATNGGMARLNVTLCRNLLSLPGANGKPEQSNAWAYRDRDDSSRAREFELREIAWQKQRAELLQKGQDPDRFRAAQLAQSVAPSPALVAKPSQPKPEPRRSRRGYGTMTYDGMMRLLHETPQPNDPRVDAMLDWAERGWSLDVNPGRDTAGLFYFWQAMVKCLSVSGEEEIVPLQGGAPIRWREEYVRKLISLQHVDQEKKTGYWVNPDATYMENDPVLVTAYAMLSLEAALGQK